MLRRVYSTISFPKTYSSLLLMILLSQAFLFLSSGNSSALVLENISVQQAGPDDRLLLQCSGPCTPKIFTLPGNRLVIDLAGVSMGKAVRNFSPQTAGLVSKVRVGKHVNPLKTRVVLDISTQGQYDFTQKSTGHEVVITLSATHSPGSSLSRKPDPSPTSMTSSSRPDTPALTTKAPTTQEEKQPTTVIQPKARKNVVHTEQRESITHIKSIGFDGSSAKGEMVLFTLNNFSPPSVYAVGVDTPKVLCEFKEASLDATVKKKILAKGKYIKSIQSAAPTEKKHVTVEIDLHPDKSYNLQQIFFKDDNLFVIIINTEKG